MRLLTGFFYSGVFDGSTVVKQMVDVIEENLNSKPILEWYLTSPSFNFYFGEFGENKANLYDHYELYDFITTEWQR